MGRLFLPFDFLINDFLVFLNLRSRTRQKSQNKKDERKFEEGCRTAARCSDKRRLPSASALFVKMLRNAKLSIETRTADDSNGCFSAKTAEFTHLAYANEMLQGQLNSGCSGWNLQKQNFRLLNFRVNCVRVDTKVSPLHRRDDS